MVDSPSTVRDGAKGGYGDFHFAPPDPIFYAGVSGRSWKERIDRSDPPPQLVTAGVNTLFTLFLRLSAGEALLATSVGL